MGSTSIHSFRYRRLATQLRTWREESQQTQRALAIKLHKPPSYVHKCEVAERKIDPLEFLDWIDACKIDPAAALASIQQLRRR
jgi:predicted transcriptional regulator